jgi:hypothetical protein
MASRPRRPYSIITTKYCMLAVCPRAVHLD